jgi:hypothetical protein
MRTRNHLSVTLLLLSLGASVVPSHGQVILNPNTLSGNVRFTNSNPAILSLLNAPGDEGISNVVILAYSVPPAPPIRTYSDALPATNRVAAAYQITLDSANPGIAYSVSPYVVMEGDKYVYNFNAQTSAPITIGAAPPPLDFEECVGVVTVQFVTSSDAPATVNGGKIICFSLPDGNYSGTRSDIPSGVTQQRIYLRSGQAHQINVTVHQGTSFYTDRIETTLSTNVTVNCDEFTTVKMVIPDSGTFATILGNVDLVGEFELTAAANPLYDYPNYTTVVAQYGPFGNQRWGALPGSNFTAASSGAYTLSNVVPMDLDPTSLGYSVYAQMLIRTNRGIEVFQTPSLNSGLNLPLPVAAGATIDLTNLFVITPGYLRGRVLLQGPPESLGRPSLLRGVLHAGDDDADGDGIPDLFATYGVYYTTVEAVGVDRLAPGATFTAANGLGYGDFPGGFNPATSAYEGQYEFALGGLLSQPSVWKAKYFNLTAYSGTVTNDEDYFYNIMIVSDETTNDVEILAGQAATNDVNYCLSEVKVVFRSTSGTFYNPSILFSSGSFNGTNIFGPANYTVNLEAASGTPLSSTTASNIGQVVMYLPQGTYQLQPSVTPSGNAQTGLQPLEVTVGCGQRIAFEPCLQVSLNAPVSSNTRLVNITGSVRSCTNNVTSVGYTLDGGPTNIICSGCGVNPSFGFAINLTGECMDNLLTVFATDTEGGFSSVTTAIHYDGTPPVINCPADILAGACDTNGAVVNFVVTATDNCVGPVSVVCGPPSGSVFPPGTNTVTCVATDSSGNTSQCSFNVIVGAGSELSIARAVIVRWTCGGTLQFADDLTGPWFDVPGATSPYSVETTAARKFYRVRN